MEFHELFLRYLLDNTASARMLTMLMETAA
jgi:hypothetical protein